MGKRIDGPVNAAALMEHAHGFHRNVHLLGSLPNSELVMMVTPYVACSAFALEAYLKVLTIIERKLSPLKTHNLRFLFADISAETQARLEARWNAECLPGFLKHMSHPHLPPELVRVQTFQQALDQSANAFVEWRYANKGDDRSFHLVEFIPMVRQAIIDQRPDLAPMRQAMKPLDGPLPPRKPSL